MKILASSLALALLICAPTAAQPTDPTTLYIRVIDTGPGLCTVTRMPGTNGDFFYMVEELSIVVDQKLASPAPEGAMMSPSSR